MNEFEYVATHRGFENESFYAADYMVNCDGRIIAYNLKNEGLWKDADPIEYPYQVFPPVNTLEVL